MCEEKGSEMDQEKQNDSKSTEISHNEEERKIIAELEQLHYSPLVGKTIVLLQELNKLPTLSQRSQNIVRDFKTHNDQDVRNLAKKIFTNRFYGLTKKNRHEKRLGDPIFVVRPKLIFFINCLFSISFGIFIISSVITPVGEEEFMELLIFFGGFIVFIWLMYWLARVFDSGLR